MNKALISQYLGSNRSDVPELAPLDRGVLPEELEKRFAEAREWRSQLVQHGVAIVPVVVYAVPKKLKETYAGWSKNPMLSESLTEAFLLNIFMNAIELMVEIDGPAVQPLLTLLRDANPDVRTSAAAFLGIGGVAGQGNKRWLQGGSNDPIEEGVRNLFVYDGDWVVELAAAAALINRHSSDGKTRNSAEQYFTTVTDRLVPEWRNKYSSQADVYLRLLPKLIATRQ